MIVGIVLGLAVPVLYMVVAGVTLSFLRRKDPKDDLNGLFAIGWPIYLMVMAYWLSMCAVSDAATRLLDGRRSRRRLPEPKHPDSGPFRTRGAK